MSGWYFKKERLRFDVPSKLSCSSTTARLAFWVNPPSIHICSLNPVRRPRRSTLPPTRTPLTKNPPTPSPRTKHWQHDRSFCTRDSPWSSRFGWPRSFFLPLLHQKKSAVQQKPHRDRGSRQWVPITRGIGIDRLALAPDQDPCGFFRAQHANLVPPTLLLGR